MMPMADLALRSSVVLASGLLLHMGLARRSAALRHFVLAAAISGAAAVVPLSLWLPEWTVELPAYSASDSPVSTTVAITTTIASGPPAGRATIDVGALFTMGWAAGIAVTGVLLLGGIWRLVRTSARAELVRDGRWTSIAD